MPKNNKLSSTQVYPILYIFDTYILMMWVSKVFDTHWYRIATA